MNLKQQGQNGLKTFLITFSVFALLFGVLYYASSAVSNSEISIEQEASTSNTPSQNPKLSSYKYNKQEPSPESVLGVTSDSSEESSDDSAFGQIIKSEPNVQRKVVLAAGATATDPTTTTTTPTTATTTTETAESTTPVTDTGTLSVTMGIFVSVGLFALFVYLVLLNPRKYALNRFEKKVLDDLEY